MGLFDRRFQRCNAQAKTFRCYRTETNNQLFSPSSTHTSTAGARVCPRTKQNHAVVKQEMCKALVRLCSIDLSSGRCVSSTRVESLHDPLNVNDICWLSIVFVCYERIFEVKTLAHRLGVDLADNDFNLCNKHFLFFLVRTEYFACTQNTKNRQGNRCTKSKANNASCCQSNAYSNARSCFTHLPVVGSENKLSQRSQDPFVFLEAEVGSEWCRHVSSHQTALHN